MVDGGWWMVVVDGGWWMVEGGGGGVCVCMYIYIYIFIYIYICTNNDNRQISPATGSAGQRGNIDCLFLCIFHLLFYMADGSDAHSRRDYELPISCSLV